VWWENLPEQSLGKATDYIHWVCRLCEGKKCVNDGPTHYSKADLESKLVKLDCQLRSWRGQYNLSDETNKKVDIANYRQCQLKI
jgi:hypothetical protein